MGIFDKIKSAIWGEEEDAAAAPPPPLSPQKPVATASASAGATPLAKASPPPVSSTQVASGKTAAPPAASKPVDVAAMLDAAVKRKGQKLDWRHSIVDLMKALDLDSSLADRKELARELNYSGDTGNSAAMNMWLHKALMKKLAENGGQVPSELMD